MQRGVCPIFVQCNRGKFSALAAPGVKEAAEVITWPFRLAAWAAALFQGLLFLLIQGLGTGLAFGESLLLAAAPEVEAIVALRFALGPRYWEESELYALTFIGIMAAMVNGAHFLMVVLVAEAGLPGEGWWPLLVRAFSGTAFVGFFVWVLFFGIFRPTRVAAADWEPFG